MKPLLLSMVILMASASVAEAAKFTGRTAQDRKVVVRTDENDVPARFAMVWRARCSDSGRIVHQTNFVQPFRESTSTFVRDGGPYTTRVRDEDGVRYRVEVRSRMRARLVTDRRWRGRFRLTMRVFRDDEFVTSCKTGRVRWSATR